MQFHVVADMVYPCVKQAGDIATTCALARHMMPPASDLGTGLQLNSAIMQPRASENGVYNNIGSYHTQPEGHVLHHTPTRAPQTTCTTRQLACQGVVYVAGEARVTCILSHVTQAASKLPQLIAPASAGICIAYFRHHSMP